MINDKKLTKGGIAMITRRLVVFVSFLLLVLLMSSCSAPVTLVSVQSFEAKSKRMGLSDAFNKVTMVLVDRGFDIKTSNKDAGLVTTEYKRFASTGENPPFDIYLQIKVTIREKPDGQIAVKMSPIVKEQNRINAAAYTEHELTYYTGEEKNLRLIKSMKPGGWQTKGQTMFMNVVQDVASVLGIAIDDIDQNVTETPKNAITVH